MRARARTKQGPRTRGLRNARRRGRLTVSPPAAFAAGLGSVILLAATVLSLVLANTSSSEAWLHVWETHVGPAALGLHLSLREWVNEGLMAIFFFVVGVDIKKEFVYGSLASIRKAVLPCLGALGGMVMPMAVYTLCNMGMRAGASAAGWAVPMATDIAFAMGVFGFFKSRMPAGAQAFLLTLATVDDLGAIAVIAVFFAGSIAVPYLTAALAVCAGLALLSRRARDADLPIYALAGVALWYCLLRGGINADIAGVVTAMALPAPAPPASGEAPETLLDKMHHTLSPWTSLLIMPVFALANTAVPLSSSALATLGSAPVAQGIALGLFLGKPIGIVAFSLAGIKLGLASWPTGMALKHLLVVGVLGGIGFTRSLFLIPCSFAGLPQLASTAKLAVLLGSLAAAAAGAFLLALFPAHATPELEAAAA